jgi:hypothetical protein
VFMATEQVGMPPRKRCEEGRQMCHIGMLTTIAIFGTSRTCQNDNKRSLKSSSIAAAEAAQLGGADRSARFFQGERAEDHCSRAKSGIPARSPEQASRS